MQGLTSSATTLPLSNSDTDLFTCEKHNSLTYRCTFSKAISEFDPSWEEEVKYEKREKTKHKPGSLVNISF
jgi:hypothetical protein